MKDFENMNEEQKYEFLWSEGGYFAEESEFCSKLECIMGRVLYREFLKLVSEEISWKEMSDWNEENPTDCEQYVEFDVKFVWKFAKRMLLAIWKNNLERWNLI